MRETDPVNLWLETLKNSYSGSEGTRELYIMHFNNFLEFIEATAREIINDYDAMREKKFKRKYTQLINEWLNELPRKYSPNSVAGAGAVVKSFFKYNDLPLGFIPRRRRYIVFHNRDIMKEEIQSIIEMSRPREKAFYTMMAQTGLRPYTLCKLQKKHIEPDFSQGRTPCKIEVPQDIAKGKYREYFTFMGDDSVRALNAYFSTRPKMNSESFVFAGYGSKAEQPVNPKRMSNLFRRALEALGKKGILQFKQKEKGKPRTVRLYNLRKYFRKYANQAGFEFVQFWMGHTVKEGVDDHYRPKDVEFHRQLYAEKAMPFLRLETATPSETEKTIKKYEKKIEELEKMLNVLVKDFQRQHQIIEEQDKLLQKIEEETRASLLVEAQKRELTLDEFRDQNKEEVEQLLDNLGYESYKELKHDMDKVFLDFLQKRLKKKKSGH